MSGILIDQKHTEKDWGLSWVDYQLPPPEAQTYVITIPGRNGTLDLTESLTGDVRYKNRQLTFTFVQEDNPLQWHDRTSEIYNYCHGQVRKIILDSEPEFYYQGRCSCEFTKEDQIYSTFTLTIDAKPFKYNILSSDEPWLWNPFSFQAGVIRNYRNITVNTTTTVNVVGCNRPVVPEIVCSKAMTLSFSGNAYSLKQGTQTISQIKLLPGENLLVFTVSGTGTVSISFREVSL